VASLIEILCVIHLKIRKLELKLLSFSRIVS